MTTTSMKEMADMLRQGARMLNATCPQCGSPLFQLKTGEIYCPTEKREVKFVEGGEGAGKERRDGTLEKTLQAKLQQLRERLDAATDPVEIGELAHTVIVVLDALNKLSERKQP